MMTNDELKKKIVDILVNCKSDRCAIEYCAECDGNPCIENCREQQLADALIAAGFVDKSDYASMKGTAVKYKAEVSKAENREKAAEHRARVAERALKIAVNSAYDYTHEEAIAQAKKELEEQQEDD